ncbi:MAG: hypothetical protein K0A92_09900, partial [Methyloprofundus sp.]|nr:hypothetical protein [Methyloprofundus sp.]
MKSKSKKAFSSQNGAATLLTAIILLIATTLVAFMAGRTALQEVKMTANNYRAVQAIAAADAGMDYAVAYFDDGGLDHDLDDKSDDLFNDGYVNVIDPAGGVQDFIPPVNSTIRYYNTPTSLPLPACVSADASPTNKKSALIQVTGTSDDGIANRTIYQCVGTRNLLQGGGPKQTLVSGSVVDLTGSAQIINRYSDLNIWSAKTVAISGHSMETYIRPPDTEIADLTKAQLIDTTTSPSILNAQKVSSGGLGSGTDIYQNDARLVAAKSISAQDIAAGGSGDGPGSFFNLFFLDNKAGMKEIAENSKQSFPSADFPDTTPDSSEL